MIATSNQLKRANSVHDGDELQNLQHTARVRELLRVARREKGSASLDRAMSDEPARLYVIFRCGARTVDAIGCSPEDFEEQQHDYGMNCFDCIEPVATDMLEDHTDGWKPDWECAAQRAGALLGATARGVSSPRPVGGIALIEAFTQAIEYCAHPSRSRYCYLLVATRPDAFAGDFTA